MKNKRYEVTKKNGGVIPPVSDRRTMYVPRECGECMECRNKKARDWQVRMMEDIKVNKNGKFVTLTFSDESLEKLGEGLEEMTEWGRANEIATRAVRYFTERWRKKYDKTVRHWLITELGHNGTERIHLHGVVWTDESFREVERIWKYGHLWPDKHNEKKNYVSERTVNYIIKYITKQDLKHKGYRSKILSSKGIGRAYIDTYNATLNKFSEDGETREYYITRNGKKIAMPIYWRNKIYSEAERDKLWIQKLDKQERWVGGEKIDISKGMEEYYRTLEYYQRRNREIGYQTGQRRWFREQYEQEIKDMNTRIEIVEEYKKNNKKWIIEKEYYETEDIGRWTDNNKNKKKGGDA